jgi:predicted helicase
MDYPRRELKAHVLNRENLCLGIGRQGLAVNDPQWNLVMASIHPVDANIFTRGGINLAPLYLYPNGKLPEDDLFEHGNGRRPNFSAAFINDFCEKLQVKFVPDGLGRPGKRAVGPELIFNYAYAVFHSPAYRKRYAQFLRADFPRLPITGDFELFRTLAGLGGELVDLHARGKGEGQGPGFPMAGENMVDDVRFQPPQGKEPGRVWINGRQYFEGVPETAWKFPVGGYLPAQRWLKDRKDRKLTYEDITGYARIVFALSETRKLMTQIDEAIENHGGWPLK